MKLNDIRFSIYNNIHDTRSQMSIGLKDVIECVKSNENFYAQIQDLRDLYNQYLKETNEILKEDLLNLYSESKSALPYITISGLFSRRNSAGLVKFNHLMQVDIDYKDNIGKDLSFLKDDPYTFVIFDSPNGYGKKIIVKIDVGGIEPGDKYQNLKMSKMWNELNIYYTNLDIKIDPRCKDISRPCYLSSDPNIHINTKSLIFKYHLTTEDTYEPEITIDDSFEYDDVLQYLLDTCIKDGIVIHSNEYDREVALGLVICDLIPDDATRYKIYLDFCKNGKRKESKYKEQMRAIIDKHNRERHMYLQHKYTISTICRWGRDLGVRLPYNLYKKIITKTNEK